MTSLSSHLSIFLRQSSSLFFPHALPHATTRSRESRDLATLETSNEHGEHTGGGGEPRWCWETCESKREKPDDLLSPSHSRIDEAKEDPVLLSLSFTSSSLSVVVDVKNWRRWGEVCRFAERKRSNVKRKNWRRWEEMKYIKIFYNFGNSVGAGLANFDNLTNHLSNLNLTIWQFGLATRLELELLL